VVFEYAVICTDLTQSSASVVACAGALGALGIRQVVLVHVIDIATASAGGLPGSAVFERQAALLEESGLHVSVDAALGYPAFEIEAVADAHRADLIVVGSHRRGLYPSTFSGSTSSDIVRISSRPVLLVALEALGTPDQSREVCSRVLASALFLTDFSERSELAARYLLVLADRGLRRAELLHVVPLGERHPQLRARAAEERLEPLAARLAERGVSASTRIVYGSPAAVAAERVRAGEHTLVVVAPHEPPPGSTALDSVTSAVIRNTAAPALLIPPSCVREPRL
jgi:nucleotide-binding universal stress UspA family protein